MATRTPKTGHESPESIEGVTQKLSVDVPGRQKLEFERKTSREHYTMAAAMRHFVAAYIAGKISLPARTSA